MEKKEKKEGGEEGERTRDIPVKNLRRERKLKIELRTQYQDGQKYKQGQGKR